MPEYTNSKIYMITCNKTNKKYIGSTTTELDLRLNLHKANYTQYKYRLEQGNKKPRGYTTSFEVLENGDYKMELLETCECKTLNELRDYEKKYIIEHKKNNPLVVNKNIPNRNKKEYYNDNRQVLIEKQRIYDSNNRERILNRMKEYYLRRKSLRT